MEEFIKFIMLLFCFILFFMFGHWSGVMDMKEKLQDKEIQLNICNANMDLFKEDFNRFCVERFEKMGC